MSTLASLQSSLRAETLRPGAVLEEPPAFFSTIQIMKLSGATARQLQWWDEKGCVFPVHDGHLRVWSTEDGVLCYIVARLREAGDSLQKIRKILAALRRDHRIGNAIRTHSNLWLIVGRKQVNRFSSKYSGVSFAFSLEAVSDKMTTRNQYFLLIAIHDIIDRLEIFK